MLGPFKEHFISHERSKEEKQLTAELKILAKKYFKQDVLQP